MVTLQNAINWVWGVVGIILFGVLMMFAIKLYKKIREKKNWEKAEKEVFEDRGALRECFVSCECF